MKKIISILISVCLVLTAIVPSVFAYEPTQFSVSNIMQEDETYLVTVKGTGEPDSMVSILVTVEGQLDYIALEQCYANSNGIFTKTFPIRNAGKYTAIINNYKSNSRASLNFQLHSKIELETNVLKFKNATEISEVKNYISEYGAMFGFDTKFYNQISEDAIAAVMLDMKASLTKENISEKFDEANLRAYIYDLNTNIEDIIEYYDSLTSIVSSDVGMYTEYEDMDLTEKEAVNSIAFENPVEDIADLRDVFFMAIVAEKTANETNTQLDGFLSKYTEYLGLDGYEDISTVKKSKLLNSLKTSEIPDNPEDFGKLFESLIDTKEETTQKPSTGSGGGGGGGAGVGSIVTDTAGFENSEAINTPVPDVSATVTFNDLEDYDWAEDAISYLALKGIVNGKSENVFAPGDYITREEFAKILVLAYGLYNEDAMSNFSDVSSDRWSYKYISSIYGYGAINGYPDGSFGASNLITREEMAVMLYRVMSKQMKIEITPEITTTLNDYDSISEFAKTSVITLNTNGIISGDNTGNFNPKNNATRAEVCKMIYNSLNKEGGRL